MHNKTSMLLLFSFKLEKKQKLLPSSALSFCAPSFSGGIPSPLITRERNQLGANGPFSFCQIHRISLTTPPPSLPCGIMLLAPLTLLSHYPLSPCVNIYHSNINCSSFQLFPSPLNLFSGHTLVIHHLHLCLFMQRLAAQFGYDLNVPLLYSLTLLFSSFSLLYLVLRFSLPSG